MAHFSCSPGGTTAHLFTHLFRGDVALDISLTAINSIIAIGTLRLDGLRDHPGGASSGRAGAW